MINDVSNPILARIRHLERVEKLLLNAWIEEPRARVSFDFICRQWLNGENALYASVALKRLIIDRLVAQSTICGESPVYYALDPQGIKIEADRMDSEKSIRDLALQST
jgi:hypothetical protein